MAMKGLPSILWRRGPGPPAAAEMACCMYEGAGQSSGRAGIIISGVGFREAGRGVGAGSLPPRGGRGGGLVGQVGFGAFNGPGCSDSCDCMLAGAISRPVRGWAGDL